MNNIWFSSDQHYGHRNISRLAGRPFPDTDDGVNEMNETLVDNWNSVVGVGDTTFVPGDFAMGRLVDSLPIVARLNGKKIMVPGNHDRCWRGHGIQGDPKIAEWRNRYLETGFDQVTDGATIASEAIVAVTPNRQGVLIDHFPYQGDSQDRDRHASHRPRDEGAWLIHGHVHEAWRQRGRQINVGVDAWAGTPVSIDQIIEMIAAGENDVPVLDWIV